MAVRWVPHGFGIILTDQRGAGFSRGDRYRYWRMDGDDAYDIMEQISETSYSHGTVYLTGLSALGIAICAGLMSEPPWAKAMGPSVATANGHITTYQGGVFRTSLIQNWLSLLGFFGTLQEVKDNEPYGQWWEPITIIGNEEKCKIPGVHAAGWYDIFLNEHIEAFNICQYHPTSAPLARGKQKIVVSPHGHCVSGSIVWPNSYSWIPSRQRLELFLQEEGKAVPEELSKSLADVEEITIYIMGPQLGPIGNYWHTRKHWPVPNTTVFYLQGDSSLTNSIPTDTEARFSYQYDPINPVITNGGNEMFLPCGPWPQERLNRKDILTFVSAPVRSAIAIVGNITATLFVSTDALDTDFTAKLSDVHPGGVAYNLVDGIFRLKWRQSKEVPLDAKKGEIYEIEINMWKTAYILNANHALQIDISSSNHPRFEKNLNNGRLLNEGGVPVTATNTLYTNKVYPSRVYIPFVETAEVRENIIPIP